MLYLDDETSFTNHIMRTLHPKKPKTWNQIVKSYYNSQKQRVKTPLYSKKGILVVWSFEEFLSWMDANKERFELIKECGHIPSVDRIDSNKHYSLDNCRLIPNELNSALGEINALQNRLKHLYEYCDKNSSWLV